MIQRFIGDIDNPGECCTLCQERHGCRAWIWRGNLHHCWLKDRISPPTECEDCVGGIFHTVIAGVCQEHRGTWNGTDIEVRVGTTIGDCCNACHVNPDCRAWTFKNSTSPRCFLKSTIGEATNCTNCRSGTRDPASIDCHTRSGVDWYGSDINGANPYTNSNPEECCDYCRHDTSCKAWLFRETSLTCYLKFEVNATEQPCSECTGGILR
eukprot:g2280.t1